MDCTGFYIHVFHRECDHFRQRYPTELNSVKTDRITLRAPTVRDVRTAQATFGNDAEKREMQLFASLAEVGVTDLEDLKLLDYQRIQDGYFRLVNEDEL